MQEGDHTQGERIGQFFLFHEFRKEAVDVMGDETDEHPRNHGKQGIGEGGMKNGVHETTNHRTQSEHKPQQQTIFSAQQDAADTDGNVERRDGSNLK